MRKRQFLGGYPIMVDMVARAGGLIRHHPSIARDVWLGAMGKIGYDISTASA
jgi:hypothetical protein